MEHIIKAAVERGASDLHIKAGDVFRARINGELRPLTKQRLTPDQTKAIAVELISNPAVKDDIDSITDYDCSWGAPGIGRFRVNLLRQRSSFMIVMRSIPFDVPTAEKLDLPATVSSLAKMESGLIFVTGPTGSGKSSTVAAMVHEINSAGSRHILTLESPIEFLHRDLKAAVTQREVGVDTESFGEGLRAALRQDPDVIVTAEVPDDEAADALLTGAETGRLVIATLHTGDAATTLSRFISLFPSDEREVARMRLSDAIAGVISLRLLPRADEEGRQIAAEVMVSTPEIRDLVRDRNRTADIPGAIESAKKNHGMQTMEQALAALVKKGTIGPEHAESAANDKQALARLLK
jgi:twitching motility protein PilT